jgi:outer membrane beta-barrel protein
MISIRSLLIVSGICFSVNAFGQNSKDSVVIIEPEKTVTNIQAAAIDDEHFELGFYLGTVSVEEFNTNPVMGLSLTYHINSNWLTQAQYAESSVQRAAFEDTSGFIFLSEDDLKYKYLRVMGGYKIIDGRSFLGKRHKYNSAVYFLAGVSDLDFAGSRNQGIALGLSYRAVITDWLTMNLDINNTTVNLKLFNDQKKANNSEMTIGVNALF